MSIRLPDDGDSVPSCSLFSFGLRRKRRTEGWAKLPEEEASEKSGTAEAAAISCDAERAVLGYAGDVLRPLRVNTTGASGVSAAARSYSSSVSDGSRVSEYMSLDADPFDDPESPARVAYLNSRLASLSYYTARNGEAVEPPPTPLDGPPPQPLSLLDIQDPRARAPVRVAAALDAAKVRSRPRDQRRLHRAHAERDAWKHEATLVYHQLCAARILALERMYERNAWRERAEAVQATADEAHRRHLQQLTPPTTAGPRPGPALPSAPALSESVIMAPTE